MKAKRKAVTERAWALECDSLLQEDEGGVMLWRTRRQARSYTRGLTPQMFRVIPVIITEALPKRGKR
jgi:hypothetical protein